jgi:hypothetical protein
MPAWLLVVLIVGATMRLSRLVTADKLTEPIRERLIRRWGEEAKRSYLITCDYCTSMYVAPIVATVAVLWPTNRVVLIALIALTASFVAGIVAAHE